jgi:RNA polymerase-binding transcription factor
LLPLEYENMEGLTPRDIRRLQARLEAERDAIQSRITARNRDIEETVQEESGVGDSGDESIRLYDREDETDANALDVETLEQVVRALGRIDSGTYGLSEVSGKPIPIERLEAVPYAATLIDEQPLEPE